MWVSGQLHACRFTHDERDCDTGGIEGWIGSTYGQDVVAKRNPPTAWNGVRSRLLYRLNVTSATLRGQTLYE